MTSKYDAILNEKFRRLLADSSNKRLRIQKGLSKLLKGIDKDHVTIFGINVYIDKERQDGNTKRTLISLYQRGYVYECRGLVSYTEKGRMIWKYLQERRSRKKNKSLTTK